ncbi:hypothetical protein GP486_008019 [Trichoglossum hirsutum]|uniref:Aminoglycoside phosphotransferase domain-containing protein n=1 Tax=Trichoglossum hirsutum TaxID=265104 RepID=A0A9P8L6I0_9PEZI|nr:hypothetical protein GP486_008019 [Trichoglossum hirsutum]
MRFVAEKTTIPVPQVHGYAFQKNSPVGFAFMLIDFIDGHTLSDIDFLSLPESRKAHFYEQLAGFYIQLWAHEFPHIGSLTLSDNASGWTFDVPRRPLSIELNAQEIEGLQACNIFRKDAIFRSAEDYFTSLIDLAFNLFETSKNSVFDKYDAEIALYDLYQFKEVVKGWADSMYNNGPFILDHGDFRPHNIRVDDDLNIVGVIDWEWGRIVPVQLFIPPTWLTGRELLDLCRYLEREDYIRELTRFKSIVKDCGEEAAPLIEAWNSIEQDGAFLVSSALPNSTLIDTVYSKYFDMRRHNSPRIERVREFLQSDTRHRELISKKVVDRSLYLEELRQLGLEERDGVALPIEAAPTNSFGLGYLISAFSLSRWWYIYAERIKGVTLLSPSVIATVGGLMVITSILHRLFR